MNAFHGIGLGLLGALLLAGCGSSDSDKKETPLKGSFIDSAVSGLLYTTSGGLTGETNSQGTFEYHDGESVTFSLGELTLGTTKAAEVLTPVELTNSSSQNDAKAVNLARLLQSLDSDDNPENGITIVLTEDQKSALKDVSLDLESGTGLSLIALACGKSLISADKAKEHFNSTLNGMLSGYYEGSISGCDLNLPFHINVANGEVWGITDDGSNTQINGSITGYNAFVATISGIGTVQGTIVGNTIQGNFSNLTGSCQTPFSATNKDSTSTPSNPDPEPTPTPESKTMTIGHMDFDFSKGGIAADWESADGYVITWAPLGMVISGSGLYIETALKSESNYYVARLGSGSLADYSTIPAWPAKGDSIVPLKIGDVYGMKARDGEVIFKVHSLNESNASANVSYKHLP